MRLNSSSRLWGYGDAQFDLGVWPGVPWDHKPAIIEEFGADSIVQIGDTGWTLSLDVYSNFHYGYQIAAMAWRLDQVYLDCPAYRGICGWVDNVAGEPFGADNLLDYPCMAAGAASYQQFGADFYRADFESFIEPYLIEWSQTSDDSRPRRPDYAYGEGLNYR